MKWMSFSVDERPDTALHALDLRNDTFSTILLTLQIIAILPTSTAQAERLFLKTERTLMAIWCSMGEDHLESLILFQVRLTDTSPEEVVTRFASASNRHFS